MTRRCLFIGFAVLSFGAAALAAQGSARADAASFERKLTSILVRALQPLKPNAPAVRTALTDRELNAYFETNGHEFLPDGVITPQLATDPGGKVRATAKVDLDAVRKAKARTWLDPLSYVTGIVDISAAGVLRAENGSGQLTIESATLGGMTVPKSLLQELVSYYSRTPESPQGFNLDQPFALPANIRAVETQRGSAIIVQ